jgi:UDP-N-acetylglucosamine 3-dehydrogenase
MNPDRDRHAGQPLGIGLIGLGEVGQHHLDGYLSTSRAKLVAVADLSATLVAAAVERTGATGYLDYRALIADPAVEAVDLALPHDLHLPVGLEALRAGRHLLVEKPMAMSVGQCDEMMAAAREAGRVLAVSHNQLFFEPHERALAMLAEGAIGEPKMARLRLGVGGRYPGWRLDPAKAGGGLLFDAGVHRFYMARALFGDPLAIQASTDVPSPGTESEGTGVVVCDFGGGRYAVIDANYHNPTGTFDDRIEVAGDRGLLALAGCEAAFEHFTSDPPLRWWHDGDWEVVETSDMDWAGSVRAAVHDFVDAVVEGRPPRVSGEDGRMVVAMIEAAYQSARTARRVAVSDVRGGMSMESVS